MCDLLAYSMQRANEGLGALLSDGDDVWHCDNLLPCVQDANNEFLLATDPSVADTSGGYFVNSRKSSMRRPAQDAEQRRKLWDTLQEQTGAKWSI